MEPCGVYVTISLKCEKKVRNNVWKRKKVIWKSWKRKWEIMFDFLSLNYYKKLFFIYIF